MPTSNKINREKTTETDNNMGSDLVFLFTQLNIYKSVSQGYTEPEMSDIPFYLVMSKFSMHSKSENTND